MKSLLFGSRRSLSIGGLIGTAALAVPTLWGHGIVPTEVDVLDGVAWLADETNGAIVRINGETGRVDAKVGFEEAQGILDVDQNGSTVLVKVGDQVHSIDVAALDWGGTTSAGDSLVVGDDAAYMVSADGAVRALDPVTLETLGEVSLGEKPAGPATVVEGRLVVPLADGTVKIVDRDEVTDAADVGAAGDTIYVSAVGRRVVVLNISAGEVFRLDPGNGRLRGPETVEVPSGALVVPTRLSPGRLWLLSIDTGELVGIAPSTGKVTAVAVADGGHDLVGPVVNEGNVYLVDRTAKAIVQVPMKTMKPQTHKLEIGNAGRVEVMAEGGKVFVNDPTSALAVVIDGDDYTDVDKYDDDGVATATPPNTKTPPPPRDEGPQGPQTPAPPRPQPPASPRRVEAQAGNESATVSWIPGGGGPATSFFVTYDGLDDPIEVPGNRLSVPVNGLENGEEYVFEVWAENDQGESAPVRSNPVTPNDRVPGTPENVTAVAGNASATVSWSPAAARGRDITGYVVTSAPDGIVATAPGTATQVVVPGLRNGSTYTFTVTAVNDLDVQSAPSAPSAGVLVYGPPGQVPVPVVTPGNGTLSLDWTAPENLSNQAVSYTVTVAPADATPAPTEATDLVVDGLTNGIQYTLTITASNDRGAGDPTSFTGTPGYAPDVNSAGVNRTGDRQFQVAPDIDSGGRNVTACTVTVPQTGASASCLGGPATFDVPLYNTGYTFNVDVATELGNGNGSGSSTSATRPMSVRNDRNQFDGWCTWLAGHPGVAAYFAEGPDYRCPNRGNDATGYIALGSAVRAECWAMGEEVHDDSDIGMLQWVRIEGLGWMPGIYFSRDPATVTDSLPGC